MSKVTFIENPVYQTNGEIARQYDKMHVFLVRCKGKYNDVFNGGGEVLAYSDDQQALIQVTVDLDDSLFGKSSYESFTDISSIEGGLREVVTKSKEGAE